MFEADAHENITSTPSKSKRAQFVKFDNEVNSTIV